VSPGRRLVLLAVFPSVLSDECARREHQDWSGNVSATQMPLLILMLAPLDATVLW